MAKRKPAPKPDPAATSSQTASPDPAAKLTPTDTVPEEILEAFEKRRKYLAAGKANYARADKMLAELLERCEPGVSVTLPPATKKGKPERHTLVDNFADKNEIWCGRAAKRFDVKVQTIRPQDE